ncbi:MAG TPA: farnesyl-diphosphate synthase, partial [Eubacteriaceae bacterium]|nr:farnesyl-diphosphate synthase [Eubacteriaceae bacterium]
MEKIQDQIPQTLFEAMNYSVKNGGKRLRPILLLETAKQEKEATNEAVALACALELIHTYSLVHDDLPAMDNDDLRRGKPTNHIVFGEDLAILAGDGLLNYAYEIMLEEGVATGNAGYRKAMATIAKAAGSKGMVGGQADDI